MERKTYEDLFFFFHETLFQITIMRSDDTVVSVAAVFFNSCSYYNSYTWSKTLHWQLNKVILSGMYNCNFEAMN